MTSISSPVHWLEYAGQRLGLVPTLGGGVAAWERDGAKGKHDLWRPWDGLAPDMYTMASFPLVPWSNRISQGGFVHNDVMHPIRPNRMGETYPIHGDGWLQAWQLSQPAADTVEMTLTSKHFDGTPYHYSALQRFVLHKDGMSQTLQVTHLGEAALPYGLGQHPAFLRTPLATLHAPVQGVWLSSPDLLPTVHTQDFPPSWDPRVSMPVSGSQIDNAYTGWSGKAHIDWPEHELRLHMQVPEISNSGLNNGYCLLYRPPQGPHFCFEPVTHPIDAFHVDGKPGLQVLKTGQTLSLQVEWRFEPLLA